MKPEQKDICMCVYVDKYARKSTIISTKHVRGKKGRKEGNCWKRTMTTWQEKEKKEEKKKKQLFNRPRLITTHYPTQAGAGAVVDSNR